MMFWTSVKSFTFSLVLHNALSIWWMHGAFKKGCVYLICFAAPMFVLCRRFKERIRSTSPTASNGITAKSAANQRELLSVTDILILKIWNDIHLSIYRTGTVVRIAFSILQTCSSILLCQSQCTWHNKYFFIGQIIPLSFQVAEKQSLRT